MLNRREDYVYSWWKPQYWLKALYFIFSLGSLRSSDVHRCESGRCRTLPFFLTLFYNSNAKQSMQTLPTWKLFSVCHLERSLKYDKKKILKIYMYILTWFRSHRISFITNKMIKTTYCKSCTESLCSKEI